MTARRETGFAGHLSKADVSALTAITAAWIAMVVVINPVGDFPLNDDWIFGGAVRSLLAGNGFRIPGPSLPDLLTQALWGSAFCLPFGFSFTALRVSTLTAALLGLWLFHALVRDNGISPRLAFVATAALAVNPLTVALANSFMTDVPFMTLMLATLYFLVRFLREESWPALATGLIVALLAILTRQIGVACLLAFAIANSFKYRFRPGPAILGALPLVFGIGVHLAWQHWLVSSGRGPDVMYQGVTPFVPHDLGRLAGSSVRTSIYIAPYIGFVLVPVVAIVGALPGPAPSIRARLGFAAVCVIVLALLWWRGDLMPSVGNVLDPAGIGPLTQRDTFFLHRNLPQPSAWTTAFWIGVTGLGVVGAAALAGIGGLDVARRMPRMWRGQPGHGDWLWIMAVATGISYWAAILLLVYRHGNNYDRYCLPLLPIVLILLLTGDPRPAPRRAAVMVGMGIFLLLTGGLSAAATADYLAWNRTRWAALHDLTEGLKIPPTRIDGGWEFNGSMLFDPAYRPSPDKSSWWVQRDDYLLASGPVPGYREVVRYAVPKLLPVGVRQVVVLRRVELTE